MASGLGFESAKVTRLTPLTDAYLGTAQQAQSKSVRQLPASIKPGPRSLVSSSAAFEFGSGRVSFAFLLELMLQYESHPNANIIFAL